MVTYATRALACAADFDPTHGEPLNVAGWSFVFELMFATGSNWQWHDATGHLLGLDMTRGAPVVGGDPQAGYGVVELDSPAHQFAPWNDTADSFAGKGAQFGPDILFRFGVHDDNQPGAGYVSDVWATGLVEQWAGGGNELVPSALLTVTDTMPWLGRDNVVDEDLAGGSHVDTVIDAILAAHWKFGTINDTNHSLLCTAASLFTGSPLEALRRVARSDSAEVRVDRHGRAWVSDTPARRVLLTPRGATPTYVELNSHDLIVDTVKHVPDTSGVVNDIDLDNVDSDGPSTGSDATSATAHGTRNWHRTDYLRSTVGALNEARDVLLMRAELTDRVSIELDDRHIDTLVAGLDLDTLIHLTHAPHGAPAGVIYGEDGNTYLDLASLGFVRQFRWRISANGGNGFNLSAVISFDAFGYLTVTGQNLRTVAGDQLRTCDGLDDILTPQRNLIHA